MCVLLTFADNRKSATARCWKGKMAMFGRFLLFSASMFSQIFANLVKGRKLRKPTKRWKAELGSLELRIMNDPNGATVGLYHPQT